MVSLFGDMPEPIQINSASELIQIDPTFAKSQKKFIAELQKAERRMLYLLKPPLRIFRAN